MTKTKWMVVCNFFLEILKFSKAGWTSSERQRAEIEEVVNESKNENR